MSVDESHLSASSHERRNSLEKHLQTRPEMQDLKDRHILLDTNVAPYILPQRAAEEKPRFDKLTAVQVPPKHSPGTCPPAGFGQSEAEPGEAT